jgi:hypothetical protein
MKLPMDWYIEEGRFPFLVWEDLFPSIEGLNRIKWLRKNLKLKVCVPATII